MNSKTPRFPPGWEDMFGLSKKPQTPAEEVQEAFRRLNRQFPPLKPKL